ncbi:hypothetical protein SAMN05421771_2665 [Granulicella pectinivorans]|uniref:Methyltransferase type 11 domain-containing protein n=1 Tax=Granulicella pectinivorans TaxID=474950 RepID=A0A1I6MHW2_9BACT|nr:class I SAM-dependent methyltransferase [Granulicella pectinivorans]SFS15201.1 hypothetical protein SAMN05421771_2665 [Granulicella pectinivorans]
MARKRSIPEAVHPFDEAHGVETSGLIPAENLKTGHPHDDEVTAYYGVAPSILRSLIARWLDSGPSHSIEKVTFIDIGAGKGRGLLIASEYPFKEVLGIELNPELAALAQKNISHWVATQEFLAPMTLIEQDATEFYFPDGPCLLFLFHPFESKVLAKLMRRIETQFARRRGTVDLLYVNCECRALLDGHPAFERLFFGPVAMTPEDHVADLAAIAQQAQYGSTGDEECAIYRYVGRTQAA